MTTENELKLLREIVRQLVECLKSQRDGLDAIASFHLDLAAKEVARFDADERDECQCRMDGTEPCRLHGGA